MNKCKPDKKIKRKQNHFKAEKNYQQKQLSLCLCLYNMFVSISLMSLQA